jgi:DNA-nicking Smr family endonuclease
VDFGDILDEWERQSRRPGGTKQSAAQSVAQSAKEKKPRDEKPAKPDPLTAWLAVNTVPDKDAEGETCGETGGETGARAGERRRRLLGKRPDGVIDLHGLTRNQAWEALDSFFEEGRRKGFEKLLVVHGKGSHSQGESVLKRTVREYIERCPFAGESGHGAASAGGSGVTWVLLKSLFKL